MAVDPLAQMAFPLSDSPGDSARWITKLQDAFADPQQTSGFLPLAEEALRAHPGDGFILCLAATAALLDDNPKWALIFLKRHSKRYLPCETNQLLYALALAQQNKLDAAFRILERHELTMLNWALRHFPGGWERREWFRRQFDRILRHNQPAAPRRAIASVRGPVPVAAKSRPTERPRSASPPPAPVAAAVPVAPPGLPRIDIEIPLITELDLAPLMAATKNGPSEPDGGWYRLRERFAHLGLAQGFDELLCLPNLRGIETFRYQVETVRKVLKQFRGRVLLADEVGLGKTIEAGMVLKEYLMRGMVESVLVLVPAPPLTTHWCAPTPIASGARSGWSRPSPWRAGVSTPSDC
jgi:hypothetical protein